MVQPGIPIEWSPHWRLEPSNDTEDGGGEDSGEGTVLVAGADRRVRLTGLGRDLEATLQSWFDEGRGTAVGADQRRLADRLVELGPLVPPTPGPGLRVEGDRVFADKLAHAMELEPDPEGLPLLIRTGDRWPTPPPTAHLAVDCSMHHTLVLGPYVVPGLTACTTCLTTRLQRRWPTTPAAPSPRVQRSVHVVAELVAIQVDLIRRQASPLVNATTAWNLEQGTADRQTLLKSPGCPTCDQGAGAGRIALPWVDGGTR